MGASGASFCLQACRAGCPAGYACSTTPVPSVDGASAPQCMPQSGSCEMTTPACVDDTWEVNDALGDATRNPALTPGSYNLVSCPSATDEIHTNDDWFRFVVASDQRVDLQLSGGGATDLDLHLYQADGTPITASTGPEADDDINACLSAATYYVKVNGFGSERNPYTLGYTSRAESCTQACVDDGHEPDSAPAQARDATASLHYESTGNQICRDNDDYYKVLLFTGDILIVDLLFSQATASQDLDIHVYHSGVDLTPCDPGNTSGCLLDNGQGATSNEHAEFEVAPGCNAGCEFDVVVHGFNHSVNSYDIAIDIE
jgi:type 1 fimbria pilin